MLVEESTDECLDIASFLASMSSSARLVVWQQGLDDLVAFKQGVGFDRKKVSDAQSFRGIYRYVRGRRGIGLVHPNALTSDWVIRSDRLLLLSGCAPFGIERQSSDTPDLGAQSARAALDDVVSLCPSLGDNQVRRSPA